MGLDAGFPTALNSGRTMADMSERARAIFRQLVEAYLSSGDPVGSRTLSQRLPISLSPASVRNVLSDLEKMGLLYSPHTSAGRVPTDIGLRLFVDGMLEVGDLSREERDTIEERIVGSGRASEDVLTQATALLSGLSHCAGLVVADKQEHSLRHFEFVPLSADKALAVLVGVDGTVENRLIDMPAGLPPSALIEASNYMIAKLRGRSLESARAEIAKEIEEQRAELDELTAKIVAEGLATLSARPDGAGDSVEDKILIVRGASNLLDNIEAHSDLERIRTLFDEIERRGDLIKLLEMAKAGQGVRVFIGSENKLFSLSGSSVVAAPYADSQGTVVGVIGVIGPTRLNYARIVPMVDYTARVVGRLLV